MVAAITSDELLTRIKCRAQVPAADGRLADSDILAICDDLLISKIGRAVYDADDGRWVHTAADVSVTSGRSDYRIPDRAWSGGVDDVLLVDSAGNMVPLVYVDRSEAWEYTGGLPAIPRFTIFGDVIRLLPAPTNSSHLLRVRYVRRPSKLVAVADCASIASGGVAASALTVNSVPTAWGSSETVDVIEKTPGVASLEDDVAVSISGTTLTRSSGSFATSGAYAVEAGDYACLAGTSCVVQVPDVALGYLAELGARDVCAALGDIEGARAREQFAEQQRADMEQSIAERSRRRPKVVPSNSPQRLMQRRAHRGWWRR